ncbi:MAG TPA: hypothetical protein VGL46_11895 [Pseudonocardiaceae bacterium]
MAGYIALMTARGEEGMQRGLQPVSVNRAEHVFQRRHEPPGVAEVTEQFSHGQ